MLTHSLPHSLCVETLFPFIQDLPYPVWLDSSDDHEGRYHIVSAAPEQILRVDAHDNEDHNQDHEAFFQEAQQLLEQYTPVTPALNLPFQGGLIGFISYELGAHSLIGERAFALYQPTQPTQDATATNASSSLSKMPMGYFGLYLWALIVDKQDHKTTLVFHPECSLDVKNDLIVRFTAATTPKRETDKGTDQPTSAAFSLLTGFNATTRREAYTEDINTILDYIQAGDVYQVNYAQHFNAAYTGNTLDAYLALRAYAPAPYSGYLELDTGALLCQSPEQFLSINDRLARTSPIKGTAPRSSNTLSDQRNGKKLKESEKNRAENLMIVDLMRNDLSQHAQLGSVKVSELFSLKSYSNVHHLVSEIEAELRDEATAIDVLPSMLPAGSITGAPKKRAVEIIAQLEAAPRHFYCGNLGYLSLCGKTDFNIGIRSLVADQTHLHCWGGGGIVAESSAAKEHDETLHKVGGLMKLLERVFATKQRE